MREIIVFFLQFGITMCLLFHQFPVPVGYAKNVESLQTLKCSYYENGNVFECNYHEEGNLMWKPTQDRKSVV